MVAIAQRILRSINQFAVPVGNSFWYGSLSIGVAARLADMDNFEALIKMADQSLYLAKQSGRNCVKTIFDQRKTRSQTVKTRGALPNSNGQQS
ncbi:diguanylate cyclase [Picosynechococcus sp. PCC 7003]|uniref:GGDEF domain-containing protein n=1 Tax=Picosynechococcus sp. PCC 7003 TaxID=374981 RepID=UPI0009FE1D3E|nr:diguanylate cyclase [Picosynechococcus sp. PCC 7003]